MSADKPKPPELSEEEIAERIRRTEEHPQVKLLRRLDANTWNRFVCRKMGDKEWRLLLARIGREFQEQNYLREIRPIDNKELTKRNIDINTEIDINFEELYFPEGIDLSNRLINRLDCKNCYFGGHTDFSGCNIIWMAMYECSFVRVDFSKSRISFAELSRCQYKWAHLFNVKCSIINFLGYQNGSINFKNSELGSITSAYCRFDEIAFEDSTIQTTKFSLSSFRKANFSNSSLEYITCSESVFNQVNFNYCNFGVIADFTKTSFLSAPSFHDIKFQEIFFEESRKHFQNKERILEPHKNKYAWQTLIKLMDDIHNLPQRQIFHEKLLEVEELEEREKGHKIIAQLYREYKALGYGYSIAKPLGFLAAWAVILGALYAVISANIPKSIAYALGNMLPFLGTSRKAATNFLELDVFEKSEGLHTTIMIIGGFQSLLSIFLLFLIGLALRNRFRIK